MADLIKAFKEAIHPSLLLAPDKGNIRIVETGAQATNREYKIRANLPHVAFTLDKKRARGAGHPVFPALNDACVGVCSVADSVVVCRDKDNEERQCAFIVELKSSKPGTATKQIRSSKAFVAWVMELLSIHHGFRDPLPCYGLIVTARKTPLKGTSRVEKLRFTTCGTGPAKLLVAEWDHGTPLFLTQMLAAALDA